VDDQVIVADEGEGGVVGVVQPLAAYLPVQPGDLSNGLLAPTSAALLAGEVPLGRRELPGGRGEVAPSLTLTAVPDRMT
jgi:hypothetical protein